MSFWKYMHAGLVRGWYFYLLTFFFPKVHKDVHTELHITMEGQRNHQLSKSAST